MEVETGNTWSELSSCYRNKGQYCLQGERKPAVRVCRLCIAYGNVYMHFNSVISVNPYPTAFPYGNGMVLHFYQQQESSTTKTVHKVINKGLKAYV